MKKYHENHRILLNDKLIYLLQHWDTDEGIALIVSGPKTVLLHEHIVTEEDGSKLDLSKGTTLWGT